MKTLVCPTCGCSLVRLGVGKDQAAIHSYNGEEYHFCCQQCADLFFTDPQRYLQETKDLIVCPTCLGEKPVPWSTTLKHAGEDVHFCRCPYCVEVFQEAPEYYLQRLEGKIPFEGVMGHDGCCVRPE